MKAAGNKFEQGPAESQVPDFRPLLGQACAGWAWAPEHASLGAVGTSAGFQRQPRVGVEGAQNAAPKRAWA